MKADFIDRGKLVIQKQQLWCIFLSDPQRAQNNKKSLWEQHLHHDTQFWSKYNSDQTLAQDLHD